MQENLFFLSEQLVFCFFISYGLSLMVQTRLYMALLDLLNQSPRPRFLLICLVCGLFCLPFSLLLVLTHNDWSLSPSIIVTLTGWVALIKSLLLFLCPQLFWKMRKIFQIKASALKWLARIAGFVYLVLGLVVLSNFYIF